MTEDSRTGLPLLRMGFRPLFLAAAFHAAVFIPLWLLAAAHGIVPRSLYYLDWHTYENLFGFGGALIGGFVLTAATNWTGQKTLHGPGLALACLAWIAGRLAPWIPAHLGGLQFVGGVAYFWIVAWGIGRPIFRTRARRNYGVVAVVFMLGVLQWATLYGLRFDNVLLQITAPRMAMGFIGMLLVLISGRILPFFTSRVLEGYQVYRHSLIDTMAMVGVVSPFLIAPGRLWGMLGFLIMLSSLVRIMAWFDARAMGIPLLAVLHVPNIMFALFGFTVVLASVQLVPVAVVYHTFAVGILGLFAIGMIVRVSRGHSGRPLQSNLSENLAFLLIFVAWILRVSAALVGTGEVQEALYGTSVAWSIAWLIVVINLIPRAFRARPDGQWG